MLRRGAVTDFRRLLQQGVYTSAQLGHVLVYRLLDAVTDAHPGTRAQFTHALLDAGADLVVFPEQCGCQLCSVALS